MRPRSCLFYTCFSALTAAGCHGEDLSGPSTGTLEVSTQTSGVAPNSDGYELSIDGGAPHSVAMNAQVTLVTIPGSHQLAVAGFAANCHVIGDNPRQVTVTSGNTTQTLFSIMCSDSRRIVFQSDRDGNSDIFTIKEDGTGMMNLTRDPADDMGAVWSPDGGRLAFWSNREQEFGDDIYVINADGTGRLNLTRHADTDGQPAWSPDGSQIAFTSMRSGGFEVFVMNSDGASSMRLAYGYSPAWSPDGNRIAFVGDGGIYLMNADGTGQTALTSGFDTGFSWSPDGRWIAFSRIETDENDAFVSNLWVMGSDGTSPRNLTNFVPAPGPDRHEDGWSWSPNSDALAYATGGDIYTIRIDGTNRILLTGRMELPAIVPNWSPQGDEIVFSAGQGAASDLFIMARDGSNIRNLTNRPALQGSGVWQP